MKKDEPAFPHFDNRGANNVCKQHNGLTKLETFAAMAMQGDWASQSEDAGCFVNSQTAGDLMPRTNLYVEQAKALIAALEANS